MLHTYIYHLMTLHVTYLPDIRIEKLIGKPEIRFTGFKPVTGLQNVQPVVEFL